MRDLPWQLILRVLLGATVFVASSPSPLFAQSAAKLEQDDLLGTWQLDLAKSKYSPGPAPKGESRIYRRDQEGIKGTVERRYADGRVETIEYRADFGQEYPVSGTEAYDAVKLKKIDSHTAEAVLSHAGRVFGTARRVISDDARTMTITFQREDDGVRVKNIAVYYKETK
jgi:hypothetical protein